MATIVVTIYERTAEDALRAVAHAPAEADALEIRADRFSLSRDAIDLAAFRRATSRPLIYTRRGAAFEPAESRRALEAGFDLVDIEYSPSLDRAALAPLLARAILSFHDFDGAPSLDELLAPMTSLGADQVKIAVTPRRFSDNLRLLAALESSAARNLTVFGMGTKGLYSRILAPFFGSRLAFVAADPANPAAPAQLSLDQAAAIYGDARNLQRPEAVFAVVGNPAHHSMSPAIHNERFRAAGVRAAYTIAEVDRFDEVAGPFFAGLPYAPRGMSITAPFKQDAYESAIAHGVELTERARRCGAVNTMIRRADGSFAADNTDVDGIASAFAATAGKAAVLGGGGTARPAIFALQQKGLEVEVFVRNPAKADSLGAEWQVPVRALDELERFSGAVVVNTISGTSTVRYPASVTRPGVHIVDVAYTPERTEELGRAGRAGASTADGMAVLTGQAEAQSRMFLSAVGGKR